jgi:GTP-binding protein
VPISGLHGRRVNELLEHLELLAPRSAAPVEPERPDLIRVAIVGRPNVGKSSLTNHLLGADRMIVSPVAGTTRDAIDAHAVWNNREFLWIDTAGLRASKSKASAGLEGLTRIMAERAIDRCDVALLLVDGVEGLTDGDVAVGRLIDERHRACVVAVNKWDAVQDRATASQWFRDHHPTDLPFMSHSPLFFISAQTGHNVPELLASLVKVRDAFHRTYDKDELEAYLWKKIQERPYTHGGQKLIFRGVEPAAAAPPTFVIRTNMEPDDIHFSYRRRLENLLREAYELNGVPIVLRFRRGRQ